MKINSIISSTFEKATPLQVSIHVYLENVGRKLVSLNFIDQNFRFVSKSKTKNRFFRYNLYFVNHGPTGGIT